MPNVVIILSASSCDFRQCPCEMQQKGRDGGGGWVHPEGANSMAVSGLRGRKVLVSTGRAISAIFGINGLRK